MNALELAANQIGLSERGQAAAIQDYLQTGGVNLDPATTAWCAAFVNATLKQSGQQGTGSNMARSFLEWGQPATTPQAGDIGVLPRGQGGVFGHVGFVESVNPDGSVVLVAGNQGDAVSRKTYSAKDFLGFRRGAAQQPMPGNALAQMPQPVQQQSPLQMPMNDPQQFTNALAPLMQQQVQPVFNSLTRRG